MVLTVSQSLMTTLCHSPLSADLSRTFSKAQQLIGRKSCHFTVFYALAAIPYPNFVEAISFEKNHDDTIRRWKHFDDITSCYFSMPVCICRTEIKTDERTDFLYQYYRVTFLGAFAP